MNETKANLTVHLKLNSNIEVEAMGLIEHLDQAKFIIVKLLISTMLMKLNYFYKQTNIPNTPTPTLPHKG